MITELNKFFLEPVFVVESCVYYWDPIVWQKYLRDRLKCFLTVLQEFVLKFA
jgi:hypothetical protein